MSPRVAVALAFVLAATLIAATDARADDVDGSDPFGDDGDAPVAVPVLTDLSPRDTRVLLGAELVRAGYRTLGEALAYEAGFSRERTSRGYEYALRGIPAGVLLVVDDVPQIIDGERDILDVDDIVNLSDVERVEIVRGPVTAIHGAGALVGVVRITTIKPGLTGGSVHAASTFLVPTYGLPLFGERDIGASGTARVGDAGVRVSARVVDGADEMWRLHAVPVRYQTIGNATLPVTKEDVFGTPTQGQTLQLRAVAQWKDVVVDAGYASDVDRSPLSAFSHGLVDDDPQTTSREITRGRALWQGWIGPAHLETALWLAHHHRVDDGPLYPKRGIFTDGGELSVDAGADTAGALLRLDIPLTRDQRIVLAAFGDATQLDSTSSSEDPRTGEELPNAVTLKDTTGTAAAAAEWQADLGAGFHATAGIAAEARTAFPVTFAPRTALAWSIDDVTLRASYAEGTRAPDRYDITALAQTVVDGRVVGAGSAEGIRPEHVRTLELSSSWSPSPNVLVDARAYGLRHEDALTDTVVHALLVPTNLDPRIVVGGEATGALSPFGVGGLLTVDGGVAASKTVNGPSIDEDFAQATAGVRVMPWSGVTVGVRGRALLRSPVTSGLVDAWLALFPFGDTLGMTVAARNVFDGNEPSIDREAPPQADPVLLPSPGRTITIGVEARF